ncbi:hypothetical protein ACTD5D_28280 [Nocardia takedensis]|uniref:hypothetical protein n=1 Tax=Nocardia takedensis TaxID=259390 RepID=UPI00031E2C3B|nr:hypothetical protein [Nocardia takedensis]
MRTALTVALAAATVSVLPAVGHARPPAHTAVDEAASSGSSEALPYLIRCLPFGRWIALSSGMPDDGPVGPGWC